MSFDEREKARLTAYAESQWGVAGHVLPYELAGETLHRDIRASALEYFDRHDIAWWISPWDKRTKELPPLPTGHLNSSQVACVNHLEPSRLDRTSAQHVVANIDPTLEVMPTDNGFVDYEWIGLDSYLGESGPRTRGANVTSLDAVMCAEGGTRVLLAIEWNYLERYGKHPVARSSRGTDCIATYRPLLEDPRCPIAVDDIEWLFFEPYYQLMRQTLLAWKMAEHGKFGAEDWLHIHVVPEGNIALRHNRAAPNLVGASMAEKWLSVLKAPDRYHLLTPSQLVDRMGESGRWLDWRRWLRDRYLT